MGRPVRVALRQVGLGLAGVPDFEDFCFSQFPSPSAVQLPVYPILLVASPTQMLWVVAVSRVAAVEGKWFFFGWRSVGCPAGYPVDTHSPAVRIGASVTGSADFVLP
jgi:hypothetical protein